MNSYNGSEIAIVGFAGRFPGAPDVETFWSNLRDGVESIRFSDLDDLRTQGVDEALLRDTNFVPAVPDFEGMAEFDAGFFGFSPRDAAIMDPQHRIFLEVAWHAFEHAGYDPRGREEAVGVYAGVGPNDYYVYNLLRNRRLMDGVGEFLVRHTSNDKDFFATRLSYLLDLRGPCVNVQTACSTSLVAVHLGAQALLSRECDMALVGGATILTREPKGYLYREGEILSQDGHCRAFDAKASGTLFGSGAGAVILKRLGDALDDGDTVYAVVRGSAVNNDGAQKVGYMAPSVEGQAAAISEAMAVAGVDPRSITYVEAHGTGTNVGDPIEVAALTQAFRTGTVDRQFCGLGSVKANIGHLDHAAGVSSLIKTVLALHHKQLPPSLNFDTPNPKLGIDKTPFYVNDRLQGWAPASGQPRRAGVNSLGIGGTNAFLVLEEGPAPSPAPTRRTTHVLTLSAKSDAALDAATDALADALTADDAPSLADVAHTLLEGRAAHEHRRAVVAQNQEGAVDALRRRPAANVITGRAEAERPVAMMFSGQGAQYAGMGRDLYDTQPVFRETVDACTEHFGTSLGIDLRTLLYPDPTDTGSVGDANDRLAQTQFTQPALFAIEVATARLWQSWGIEPIALIGHSIGEYVAAHVAGVLSLENACRLVAARGSGMQAMERGTMLSVALSEAEAEPYLADTPGVSVSVLNHPSMVVVGGTGDAVAALQERLEADDVPSRPLRTSHAFHSAMMEPMLGGFRAEVEQVRLHPPQIPIVSTLTGTWLTDAEATDPNYWVRHVRQPVRFAAGIHTLLEKTSAALIEAGPGNTLVTLAQRHPSCPSGHPIVASLRHPQEEADDVVRMHRALGELWAAGVTVRSDRLYTGEGRRRVSVPRYPFERTTHWIDRGPEPTSNREPEGLGRTSHLRDFFYVPSWTRSAAPALPPVVDLEERGGTWLVFDDAEGRTAEVVNHALRAFETPGDPEPSRLVQGAPGDVDSLALASAERRAPRAGEVEIHVHAAALQFKDVLLALGVYADDPVPMGAECAGVVVRVGEGVTSFAEGDAVIAAGFDSFRNYVTRDVRTVARCPNGLRFEDAVTLPSGFLTAYHSLVRVAALKSGERVLIQSATGGVGQSAVQIARMIGAEIYATAGSEAKREELRAAGIEHVYDSRTLDFGDAIMRDTGGAGVDVVIGAFTGEFVDRALSILAPGGRFTELGKTDVYTPETLPNVPNRDTIRYTVVDMDVEREERTDAFQSLFDEVIAHVEAGRLAPLPRHVYPWTEAADAFRLMSQTKHRGKVVLQLQPEPPRVVTVRPGATFEQTSETAFIVRSAARDDADALLGAVGGPGEVRRVVHGWALDDLSAKQAEAQCFTHLVHLAQALEHAGLDRPLPTTVLSADMQRVGMEGRTAPDKALLLGPVRVVPHEIPELPMRSVDVSWAPDGMPVHERQIRVLAAEVWATGRPSAPSVVALRGTDQWTQAVQPAPMDAPHRPLRETLPLRAGGVYLVTGGTGGLGLELIDHLTAGAEPEDGLTLVLVSRSGLADRSEWSRLLAELPDANRTARSIRTVLALEARGVTVDHRTADVADLAAMQAVVNAVTAQYGPLRGAVHAAGVVDDALVALKSDDSAARVLAPKVDGTRVLDSVLADQPIDFLLLFSSVSAALGLPGQVDYTAANAFLDAFAQEKRAVEGRPVTALGWGAWQEVGMAADLSADVLPGTAEITGHPMFDRTTHQESSTVFTSTWTPRRFWVLNGHRNAAGDAVLPGTGALDLARAAGQVTFSAEAVTLRDVYFLAPLELTGGAARRVRLTVEADGAFTLESQPDDGPTAVWTEHATGVVAATDEPSGASIDAEAIRDRCSAIRTFGPTDRTEQEASLRFGPEWRCLREVHTGTAEAVATLELPAVFAGELNAYALHPALLDMATGFGLPLVGAYDARDFYVPMTYAAFRMHRPLPRRLVSHMRCLDPSATDVVTFDVTLADETGTVVAEAEGFQMKRVPASALSAKQGAPFAPAHRLDDPLAFNLALGLRPEEALAAFDRAVATGEPHVMVSAVDVPAWQERIRAATAPPEADAETPMDSAVDAARGNDAESGAPHQAPRDAVETFLAELWGDLLGTRIGRETDFFDAGGHSLIAVRMFAKVRKNYDLDLPLSLLMEASSLAAFAAEMRDRLGLEAPKDEGREEERTEEGGDKEARPSRAPEASASRHEDTVAKANGYASGRERENGTPASSRWSPLVPIREGGDRRPFFCVHGAGGNVLNFRDLGRYLAPEQPFFGLQARGVDGASEPQETIEAMAEEYLAAIRTVQSEGPYLLGGYSAGGVVAFEMAHQLRATGEEVGLLAFLDTFCPELPAAPDASPSDKLTDHIGSFLKLGLTYGQSYAKQRLAHEQFRLRRMKVKMYEQMGQPIPVELRDIGMIEAYEAAVKKYELRPYDGRAVLFTAADKGPAFAHVGPDMGWTPYVTGTLDIHAIPGTHDDVMQEPNVNILVGRFTEEIKKLDRQGFDSSG